MVVSICLQNYYFFLRYAKENILFFAYLIFFHYLCTVFRHYAVETHTDYLRIIYVLYTYDIRNIMLPIC